MRIRLGRLLIEINRHIMLGAWYIGTSIDWRKDEPAGKNY